MEPSLYLFALGFSHPRTCDRPHHDDADATAAPARAFDDPDPHRTSPDPKCTAFAPSDTVPDANHLLPDIYQRGLLWIVRFPSTHSPHISFSILDSSSFTHCTFHVNILHRNTINLVNSDSTCITAAAEFGYSFTDVVSDPDIAAGCVVMDGATSVFWNSYYSE